MKIAFLIHRFPTLSHTFILQEMVELQRRGHDVEIVSLDRGDRSVIHPAVESYDLLSRTHYLSQSRAPAGGARPASGAPSRRPTASGSMSAFDELCSHLTREKFDVLHAAFANAPARCAARLSGETGIPYTSECHEYELYVDAEDVMTNLAGASRIFVSSQASRGVLEPMLVGRANAITIKRLSYDQISCAKLAETPEEKDLVVSACRLHPIKGLGDTLEAVKIASQYQPQLRYVVLGDGPLRAQLARRAEELGIDDRVDFRGAVAQPELLATLARSSVSMLGCRIAENGDRDGTPTSLIEAMSMGKPVVSTRLSGIPEIVDDGKTGLLAEPGDFDALAGHLLRLLGDGQLRREMGDRARKKALAMFDLDTGIDVLERGLEHAIRSTR